MKIMELIIGHRSMDIDKRRFTNEQLITILEDMCYIYNVCATEKQAIKEIIEIINTESKRLKIIHNKLIKVK